ncbi:MAG: ATP-grasp domain-containing protein [Rhodospirillales bacterium]
MTDAFPGILLWGTDLGGEWPGRCVFERVETVPQADDQDYPKRLTEVAQAMGADLVIPATEPELSRLATEHMPAAELPLLMNTPEVIRRFLDKMATSDWLTEVGVDVPATRLLADAHKNDLPLMIKPRRSSGSRGLEIVRTAAHLAFCQTVRDGDSIAQELLETEDCEFTCALFRHGDTIQTLIMRRWLVGGLTGRMVIEDHPEITDLLMRIGKRLPETAAVNVQLRQVGNRFSVFEINPRLSSTTMMRHRVGFQDAQWWVAAHLWNQAPPPFTPPVGTWVYRTYGEILVPQRTSDHDH